MATLTRCWGCADEYERRLTDEIGLCEECRKAGCEGCVHSGSGPPCFIKVDEKWVLNCKVSSNYQFKRKQGWKRGVEDVPL